MYLLSKRASRNCVYVIYAYTHMSICLHVFVFLHTHAVACMLLLMFSSRSTLSSAHLRLCCAFSTLLKCFFFFPWNLCWCLTLTLLIFMSYVINTLFLNSLQSLNCYFCISHTASLQVDLILLCLIFTHPPLIQLFILKKIPAQRSLNNSTMNCYIPLI